MPVNTLEPTLGGIFDAVHGSIDLGDTLEGRRICSLVTIATRPMLERLRRIKLLGYASHSYPAADHSRYAHALGSMHIMRLLLAQVRGGLDFDKLHRELRLFGRPYVKTFEHLEQHMLIATLIQDVGELPYSQATSKILRPADSLRQFVSDKTDIDTSGWDPKDVFTLASIFEDTFCSESNLNMRLITFLTAGQISGGSQTEVPEPLRALRHMLEGEVDADRLDYVYRDAHHTVGARGSAQSVIDSLVTYDGTGPIFVEPGPVAEFFATRASLWTTVYFSAENRFRTLLLITLLRECRSIPKVAAKLFGTGSQGDLSLAEFQALDDISLHERLRLLDQSLVKLLERRAQVALQLLLGERSAYECVWLPPRRTVTKDGKKPRIPSEVFFDTFADYEETHTVYESGSIRVAAPRFRLNRNGAIAIPLEDCCGAFSGVFRAPWSALEREGSVLLYVPKGGNDGRWSTLLRDASTRTFYSEIAALDPLNPLEESPDTRGVKNYSPPNVFVSFAWADINIVRRIVASLRRHQQRYFLLAADYLGVGGTPGENSENAVAEAEGVIVVLSRNYIMRFKGDPNGNIAKELLAMRDRSKSAGLPIVCVSVDDWRDIGDAPYTVLGFDALPFVGDPLELASDRKMDAAVGQALTVIRGGGKRSGHPKGSSDNRGLRRKATHR